MQKLYPKREKMPLPIFLGFSNTQSCTLSSCYKHTTGSPKVLGKQPSHRATANNMPSKSALARIHQVDCHMCLNLSDFCTWCSIQNISVYKTIQKMWKTFWYVKISSILTCQIWTERHF